MIIHGAILKTAGILVPAEERPEWFAEWHAELCYIQRVRDANALAFCFGAFKDAVWLRRQDGIRWLESPSQCLALLAIAVAVSLAAAAQSLSWSPFRDSRGVITGRTTRPPAGAAFYRQTLDLVRTPRGPTLFSIVHGTRNLFDVLGIPVRAGKAPALILSRSVWLGDFSGDRHIAGRVLDVNGRRVSIGAVIPDDEWALPGIVDAWLLDDDFPADSNTFVVARRSQSPGLRPPARRLRDPFPAFAMSVVLGFLIGSKRTAVKGARGWGFLFAKVVFILLAGYAWASLGTTCESELTIVFAFFSAGPGTILALLWAFGDQRRRCPDCLRLLSSPVTLGKASQTFLDWYGTESACPHGHGLLREPAIANLGSRRWVSLDDLCVR